MAVVKDPLALPGLVAAWMELAGFHGPFSGRGVCLWAGGCQSTGLPSLCVLRLSA